VSEQIEFVLIASDHAPAILVRVYARQQMSKWLFLSCSGLQSYHIFLLSRYLPSQIIGMLSGCVSRVNDYGIADTSSNSWL